MFPTLLALVGIQVPQGEFGGTRLLDRNTGIPLDLKGSCPLFAELLIYGARRATAKEAASEISPDKLERLWALGYRQAD